VSLEKLTGARHPVEIPVAIVESEIRIADFRHVSDVTPLYVTKLRV